MKYPIGIQTFEDIRRGNFVYVDKTALIHRLATEGKIYFISRPRRFGKSLLLSTLKAYFEGKRALFAGLAIAGLETEWTRYPVFHIDFNAKDFSKPGELEAYIEGFLSASERRYGKDEVFTTMGDRFISVLSRAKEQTGRQAVVLIDEYDKPLLDVLDTPQEQVNRNILKAFYSTFKAADEHLRFVMLTGVTKFSQVSVFSGFNQPNDISMDDDYDTLCGITTEELHQTFAEPIRALAEKRGWTVERTKEELRQQYDGYHFSARMKGVYNPFSILNALSKKRMDDFWFKTATPTYLIRLMTHFNENLNEMLCRNYTAEEFEDYRADVERPLPMLYQSGYITIKGYDMEYNEYRLDFPNREVSRGFLTLLTSHYLNPRELSGPWASEVSKSLKRGNLDKLRTQLTAFMAGIPYSLRRKQGAEEQERDFQYTFYLIMRLIGDYVVLAEHQQSQGRVDCVVLTPEYIYIFEFKRDGTARQALDQIHTAGYAREYRADPRAVYLIGCNFSTQTGTIDDWAVEEVGQIF